MEAVAHARKHRVRYVIGPDGAPLSVADLPPASMGQRWVVRRKAQVVAAVSGGLLTLGEACTRYTLTREEFLCWQMSAARNGTSGLRVTKLQQYRMQTESGSPPSG